MRDTEFKDLFARRDEQKRIVRSFGGDRNEYIPRERAKALKTVVSEIDSMLRVAVAGTLLPELKFMPGFRARLDDGRRRWNLIGF